MKTDISYLPLKKQEELRYITEQVCKEIHNCEMIILYGSYARNDYVDFDARIEYNVPTTFMSDFDILVLTAQEPTEITERKLTKIDTHFFNENRTPVQFVALSVQEMNKCLANGRFFHVHVKEEGIMLFNRGEYELIEGKALNYQEIHHEAQRYFTNKFKMGNSFIRSAAHALDDGDYELLSFHLHQACEFFFLCILLTYTLSNRKIHDLSKLLRASMKYVPQLQEIFPLSTSKERYIFNLLKKAYKEARYNDEFKPTREEVIAQQKMAHALRDFTEEVCQRQVKKYALLAQQKGKESQLYPDVELMTRVAETEEEMLSDKDHYKKK